jgi:hypothetical protein
MNCIIVDDEEMARAISAICTQQIFNVLENLCYWCNEIFKSKSSRSYILDIHMSNFTGFDFIQSIKKSSTYYILVTLIEICFWSFWVWVVVDYLVYNWISFYKRIHKVIAIKADESLSKK